MPLLTYPKFQAPDINGVNLSGGKVYFYEAGTSTPKDTYTDDDFGTPNANPVILDSRGEADIYLNGEYKIILRDSSDTEIWTKDNYTVITYDQWAASIPATYVSATSFTVSGNLTSDYETGRRIKLEDSATLYGLIASSTYSAPNTTITVALDSGSLSVSLAAVELSLLSVSDDSLPISSRTIYKGTAAGTADALTVSLTPALISDTLEDGTLLFVKALLANTTTTPTLNPDGIAASTIVKEGSQALVAGDIARVDHELIFRYNLTNTEWELLNPVTISASDLIVDSSIITLGAEQATTSGTSIDFTSIPSWVKKITIMLVGISSNGTSSFLIQIGDSGGVETSGYTGGGQGLADSISTNSTIGFMVHPAPIASILYHGIVSLHLEDSSAFTWVAEGQLAGNTTTSLRVSAGSKSLTATLDRLRLTTAGGTDTFDAGSINISYE